MKNDAIFRLLKKIVAIDGHRNLVDANSRIGNWGVDTMIGKPQRYPADNSRVSDEAHCVYPG
ncbi:MAG: hypothetical protein JKY88_08935 [Pseudomonadales bacterium]|nr:hypothetical protein [Pseudomonadales bacterium]